MELKTYWRIVRAGWIWILVGVLLGVGGAAAWYAVQKPVYTADASGFLSAAAASSSSGGDTGAALIADNLAKSKVKSYIDVGTWRSVANRVIEDLDLSVQPESLVRSVSITNPVDTVNIAVQASASTPEGARDIAQAWVRAMATEIESLETQNGGNAVVRLVPGDSAQLPLAPSSPNLRLALALGAVIGLVLGSAVAAIRYMFDRRIRSAEAIEKETGQVVVGSIPLERSFSTSHRLIPLDGVASGDRAKYFRVAEAMRELRTNIQFMDVDNPPRVIVVTSPLPGDGKSTTSANLAITLAANGQRVILIDGDLRRPMVASIFALVEGVGLTDVLAGRADFEDVAQPVGTGGNLFVLGAGTLPPNPSEVLGSARMQRLLAHLSKDATVIVDAPPLLPVTDAAVLTHSADGAIIVGSVGKTTVETLQKALQSLHRAGGRCLGVVINRVPVRGRGKGYYDYRYIGDYASTPQAERQPDPLRTDAGTGNDAMAGAITAVASPSEVPVEPGRRSRREMRG
ncbi:polysaccharide biosynthesis tyrosine autokinase [Microbacterium enclense]|uniref:polysaccharide biosynthesis tyrosine autokinase n=1 Tax=Microbacterium enclense TaxID=993073 RepID=UPI0021A602E4|nr:polysaccharide biosynthesis tyrosine autokinase [Microbacterium enclense]MCT2085770.1 polysaccharide biosynthesis tyrosine autokinase [Microbacterium enclense]